MSEFDQRDRLFLVSAMEYSSAPLLEWFSSLRFCPLAIWRERKLMDFFLAPKSRFEAFDEPWKEQFNKGDENWEDKWGLMTIDRKLKPGLKIPDCGGKGV